MLLLLLVVLVTAHQLSPDGLAGAALCLALGDTGEYANGYSASAFQSVKTGMTETEVEHLLGDPLEKSEVPELDDGRFVWAYSRSVRKGNYRVRTVIFDADHRVVRTAAHCWID